MKKCVYQGKQVTLADKEFLASGGQGDIYLHAGVVYKVYHDAMPLDLVEKIKELTVLDRPNIIRPLGVLYSATTNEPIGYTMDYADDTVGMPLLFTSSYIQRNSISLLDTQELVKEMADTIEFIHSKQILQVDGNEFNYLVAKNGHKKPYFIDIDSYATAKHPGTVIMPSVRDYKTKGFSTVTDWYGFGVVSFQLFTGIHPYKGKHPTLKTIEERCKANVSVFNKDVNYPATVRDFGNIPAAYKQWYEDVFEKGLRTPPPAMSATAQMRLVKRLVTAAFNIEKVFASPHGEAIKRVEWLFGKQVITTEHHIFIDGRGYARVNPHSVVVITDEGKLFEVYYESDGLVLCNILTKDTFVDNTKKADKWFSIDGRLYAIYEQNLSEMNIRSVNGQPNTFFNTTVVIAAQSTTVFENILYADILGNAVVYVPSETKKINVVSIPELNRHKVLDMKYQKGLLTVAAVAPNGDPKLFTMDGGYKSTALVEDIDIQEVNLVTLPNGVTLRSNPSDDSLVIFSANDIKGGRKILQDASLPSGAILVNNGQQAHYFVDDALYSFSMK
jgi:serine/threonine protein kinase